MVLMLFRLRVPFNGYTFLIIEDFLIMFSPAGCEDINELSGYAVLTPLVIRFDGLMRVKL